MDDGLDTFTAFYITTFPTQMGYRFRKTGAGGCLWKETSQFRLFTQQICYQIVCKPDLAIFAGFISAMRTFKIQYFFLKSAFCDNLSTLNIVWLVAVSFVGKTMLKV